MWEALPYALSLSRSAASQIISDCFLRLSWAHHVSQLALQHNRQQDGCNWLHEAFSCFSLRFSLEVDNHFLHSDASAAPQKNLRAAACSVLIDDTS